MAQAQDDHDAALSGRRQGPLFKGTDYSSQDYWERRFAATAAMVKSAEQRTSEADGAEFDWLGSGDELMDSLMAQMVAGSMRDGLTLNIGSGSSRAGRGLRRRFEEKGWDSRQIVNLDYAPAAIALSRMSEENCFGDLKTQHVVADLLDGFSLSQEISTSVTRTNAQQVTAIFDKSTADALSTGPNLRALGTKTGMLSFVAERNGPRPAAAESWAPVEVLAYNLGRVARPGAFWAVLSYSAQRFDFLEASGGRGVKEAQRLWEVMKKWAVEAPSGRSLQDTHAPAVYHWCYILRRRCNGHDHT
ncbi:hypothetical protein BDZ90DRAFT_230929 [Jaminaea rosea]|uniref:Histidine-specific methyltransferase SAM-dependent domain-containing protein n=1 Tax=Jaminaea rosea TaxID=1569628 RepID=A0A316UUE3_9BASI|nr:hypothetical protein BDZ90DRAFT_230929 [Jaminaea rosea]PWN28926.1 hypothetical protein BDZ90DRAFT_230929 [Jaminaea rosea]